MQFPSLIKDAAPRVVADPAAVRATIRRNLLEYPEVVFAYLYGSFAEGRPCRDVDVGVYIDMGAREGWDPFDVETRMSLALTRAVGMPVDVRVLNGAPVGFQHAVLRGEGLVARDEARLGNFVEHVAGQYMDFAWLGREFLREVLRG